MFYEATIVGASNKNAVKRNKQALWESADVSTTAACWALHHNFPALVL
jgi:hypothetical protein